MLRWAGGAQRPGAHLTWLAPAPTHTAAGCFLLQRRARHAALVSPPPCFSTSRPPPAATSAGLPSRALMLPLCRRPPPNPHPRPPPTATQQLARQDVKTEALNPHNFWSGGEDGLVRQYDTRLPNQESWESPTVLLQVRHAAQRTPPPPHPHPPSPTSCWWLLACPAARAGIAHRRCAFCSSEAARALHVGPSRPVPRAAFHAASPSSSSHAPPSPARAVRPQDKITTRLHLLLPAQAEPPVPSPPPPPPASPCTRSPMPLIPPPHPPAPPRPGGVGPARAAGARGPPHASGQVPGHQQRAAAPHGRGRQRPVRAAVRPPQAVGGHVEAQRGHGLRVGHGAAAPAARQPGSQRARARHVCVLRE